MISTLILFTSFINFGTFILNDLIKNDWNINKSFSRWCDIFYQDFLIERFITVSDAKSSKLYCFSGITGIFIMAITILHWNFIDWLPFVFACDLYFEMYKFQKVLKEKQGQLKSTNGSGDILAKVRIAEVQFYSLNILTFSTTIFCL